MRYAAGKQQSRKITFMLWKAFLVNYEVYSMITSSYGGLPTTALDIALLWHPKGCSFRNVATDNSSVALLSWAGPVTFGTGCGIFATHHRQRLRGLI